MFTATDQYNASLVPNKASRSKYEFIFLTKLDWHSLKQTNDIIDWKVCQIKGLHYSRNLKKEGFFIGLKNPLDSLEEHTNGFISTRNFELFLDPCQLLRNDYLC